MPTEPEVQVSMQSYKGLSAAILTAAREFFRRSVVRPVRLAWPMAAVSTGHRYRAYANELGQARAQKRSRMPAHLRISSVRQSLTKMISKQCICGRACRIFRPPTFSCGSMPIAGFSDRRDCDLLHSAVRLAINSRSANCSTSITARLIENYKQYQDGYREQYQTLFGPQLAEQMYCKAVLSSGVFSARRTSSVWAEWRKTVSDVYHSNIASHRAELGHMAEQLALNVILHRTLNYRILSAEMNWHCHCADVVRDGELVQTRHSRRVPAIIHLSDLKNEQTAEHYRKNRLFYEPPVEESAPSMPPHVQSATEPRQPIKTNPRVCVYTCLTGSGEALNEQPIRSESKNTIYLFHRSSSSGERYVANASCVNSVRDGPGSQSAPYKAASS